MGAAHEIVIGHERVFLALTDEHNGLSTRAGGGEVWSFHARLVLPNLTAEAHVHLGDPAVQDDFADFFAALAREWRGWSGSRIWRAYEGGLTVGAESDGRGHVSLSIELRERSAGGWVVCGQVPLDAGQLDQVERDTAAFVREHS